MLSSSIPFSSTTLIDSYMGASLSAEGAGVGERTGLGDIPEGCVSSILMKLDPPEICKLAQLNLAFRGASSADFIWESKLPSNYKFLVTHIFPHHDHLLHKKHVYAKLCRPNPFDGGNKEVWLDKNSGKVCLSIGSKALKITGIDDRRYWNHVPTDESRFHTVAYLQQVWWFEVVGELEFEFPRGSYGVYFRLQLGRSSKRFGQRICNVDQVHGWKAKPVRFQLCTSDGQHVLSECYMNETGRWGHYHVGDFVVEKGSVLTKVKFSMMQIDCTHTKGGLCVDSVFICPAEFKGRFSSF